MTNKTIEIEAKVKAFSSEPSPRMHKLSVSPDGAVRVYDDIAGHYTTIHAISDLGAKRIRALAAAYTEPSRG